MSEHARWTVTQPIGAAAFRIATEQTWDEVKERLDEWHVSQVGGRFLAQREPEE